MCVRAAAAATARALEPERDSRERAEAVVHFHPIALARRMSFHPRRRSAARARARADIGFGSWDELGTWERVTNIASMSMIVIGALWVLNAPLSLCLNRTGCCACCAPCCCIHEAKRGERDPLTGHRRRRVRRVGGRDPACARARADSSAASARVCGGGARAASYERPAP